MSGFGTRLLQREQDPPLERQGCPGGEEGPPSGWSSSCSVISCAFGLLEGLSRAPLIWRALVQTFILNLAAPTAPHPHSTQDPEPSATPTLSAPASHPCGLAWAPQGRLSEQPGVRKPRVCGLREDSAQRDGEGPPRPDPLIWMQLEETSQKPRGSCWPGLFPASKRH